MLKRRTLLSIALSLPAWPAAAASAIAAGRDFTVIPAQPGGTPGKIEVIEFFSYGCPYCNDFHPAVEKWLATLAKDVAFRMVPVTFGRPAWDTYARAFFALDSLGLRPRMDRVVFNAIHEQRLAIDKGPAFAAWMGSQPGVDGAKFVAAFDSFGVSAKAVQANEMASDYRVRQVATMVVDGRYQALGDTFEQVLANTSELIVRARAERAG